MREERANVPHKPVIRVELSGIVKNFGGVRALKGVDATIEGGRVLVLLGENGAGKSTLIKVLTGAVRPDAGVIRIDGAPVTFREPAHALAHGIAAVYQEPMIYPHLTVLENIFAGRETCNRLGVVRRKPMIEQEFGHGSRRLICRRRCCTARFPRSGSAISSSC